MLSRRRTKIALIVFSASGVVHLTAGILAGLQQNWPGLIFYFFGFVFLAYLGACILLGMKVEAYVKNKHDYPAPEPTGRPRDSRLVKMGGAFLAALAIVLFSLAILCARREAWLVMGICLTVCAFAVIVHATAAVAFKLGNPGETGDVPNPVRHGVCL